MLKIFELWRSSFKKHDLNPPLCPRDVWECPWMSAHAEGCLLFLVHLRCEGPRRRPPAIRNTPHNAVHFARGPWFATARVYTCNQRYVPRCVTETLRDCRAKIPQRCLSACLLRFSIRSVYETLIDKYLTANYAPWKASEWMWHLIDLKVNCDLLNWRISI